MTEFEKLVKAENTAHTIEIRETKTGKCGVANTCNGKVQVFFGADDGSDDATITAAQFNKRFKITAILES